MIKIKFTPKLDIPAFLDVMNVNVTLLVARILISGISYEADIPVRFSLDLDLYRNINTHYSDNKKYYNFR